MSTLTKRNAGTAPGGFGEATASTVKPTASPPSSQPAEPLDALKEKFLDLNDNLCRAAAETWWRQGQLLTKMKEQVGHGGWIPWIEENLHVTRQWAARLMLIGELPKLPQMESGLSISDGTIKADDLAVLASRYKRQGGDLDDLAAEFFAECSEPYESGPVREGMEATPNAGFAHSTTKPTNELALQQARQWLGMLPPDDLERLVIEVGTSLPLANRQRIVAELSSVVTVH